MGAVFYLSYFVTVVKKVCGDSHLLAFLRCSNKKALILS